MLLKNGISELRSSIYRKGIYVCVYIYVSSAVLASVDVVKITWTLELERPVGCYKWTVNKVQIPFDRTPCRDWTWGGFNQNNQVK